MREVRLGDVQFTTKVSEETIDQFIRELPEHKKESLYEIMKQLSDHNLIDLQGFRYSQDEDC
ncbi:hypothetical protein PRVXH_000461 [Proteinivorax hydrogeniformans]|uniref:Uncharacterized protein n=1 Tax=Proteinivorax hydrogeniformans TaxID=1826727 RepID=A0AAU8HUT9_9FIRM